jgi:hypothetical protein
LTARPRKPQSPEFSIDAFIKEKQKMEKRQAEREKMDVLLRDESDDEISSDGSIVNETTERALGKESNDKVKGALTRIGADLSQEGGYKFFRHKREEREFDVSWIREVEWLRGFEG